MAAEHEDLVKRILCILSQRGIRAWSNPTGQGWQGRAVKKTSQSLTLLYPRILHFGLIGSSDILGIIPPRGVFLAVEVKTENDDQSLDQKNFQRMIVSMGGIYILARCTQDVNTVLDNLKIP